MRITQRDIEWTVGLLVLCTVAHWTGVTIFRWWMGFLPLAVALAYRQAN